MGTSRAVRASKSLTWWSCVAEAMRLPWTSKPAFIAGSGQVGKVIEDWQGKSGSGAEPVRRS